MKYFKFSPPKFLILKIYKGFQIESDSEYSTFEEAKSTHHTKG